MFFSNTTILLFHSAAVSALTLLALRFGKEALIAWLSILSVALNFFVLKQVTLLGLDVTCSDALAVGYLLGLNLIQEFFGKSLARKTIYITFFISLGFLILSQIHLLYQPNSFDLTHFFYVALLKPFPRLLFASFTSFLLTQFLDLSVFEYLKNKTSGRFLAPRIAICLILSQLVDTLLFSFLGLYGLVGNLMHIIVFSLCVKGIVILLSTPFVYFSKRIAPHA